MNWRKPKNKRYIIFFVPQLAVTKQVSKIAYIPVGKYERQIYLNLHITFNSMTNTGGKYSRNVKLFLYKNLIVIRVMLN